MTETQMGDLEIVAHLVRVPRELGTKLLRDSGAVYDAITAATPDQTLVLGDMWPGLHFLLTAGEVPMPRHVAIERGLDWDDSSLENVLMGGEATPYEDAFTFARYLAPETVAALARKLARLRADELARPYDPGVLEVLPPRWSSVPDPASELAAGFVRLVDFYQAAAAAGQGILLYMS